MKVKTESEVAQSCLTLHDPMDCSLPGSSVHGIFQARTLEWVAISFSLKRLDSLNILRLKNSGTDGVQILTLYLEILDWVVCLLQSKYSLKEILKMMFKIEIPMLSFTQYSNSDFDSSCSQKYYESTFMTPSCSFLLILPDACQNDMLLSKVSIYRGINNIKNMLEAVGNSLKISFHQE